MSDINKLYSPTLRRYSVSDINKLNAAQIILRQAVEQLQTVDNTLLSGTILEVECLANHLEHLAKLEVYNDDFDEYNYLTRTTLL